MAIISPLDTRGDQARIAATPAGCRLPEKIASSRRVPQSPNMRNPGGARRAVARG